MTTITQNKFLSAENHVNNFFIIVWEFWLMRITYPSLLLLALTVVSCGGGGSPTADVKAPGSGSMQSGSNGPQGGSMPAPSTGGLVEYYGDSTVWGCKSGSSDCGVQVETTAPEAFAQALPAKYSVDASQNGGSQGVNGSTACELLNGRDGWHDAKFDELMAKKPDVKYVIMNFGINDAVNPTRRYDVSTYMSCLRSLAQIAQRNGKQVVFETPNPINVSGLEAYVGAMRQVAAEEKAGLIDEYAYLMDYLSSQNKTPSDTSYSLDGLHPNDDIYIMKGKYAAGAFAKLFP